MQKYPGYLHRNNDRYNSNLHGPGSTPGALTGVMPLATWEFGNRFLMKPGL
jgi:hypothetical protein